MGLCTKLTLCLVLLLVISYGHGEGRFNRALKVLRALSELGGTDLQREEKESGTRGLECSGEGKTCGLNAMKKCCDELDCHYPEGFTVRDPGVCVPCAKKDWVCQYDSQCCEGLQCDSEGTVHWDGKCKAPRESGPCYLDSECANGCDRAWYSPKAGECIQSNAPVEV